MGCPRLELHASYHRDDRQTRRRWTASTLSHVHFGRRSQELSGTFESEAREHSRPLPAEVKKLEVEASICPDLRTARFVWNRGAPVSQTPGTMISSRP